MTNSGINIATFFDNSDDCANYFTYYDNDVN